MNKIKIEACCGSVRDVIIADKLGFDQIELNSSLELGGMTPSVGTLVEARRLTDIPIFPMVRARPSGFNYIEADYKAMLFDAKNLIENGAAGIVFGFLNEDGTINEKRTKVMVDVIGDKPAIFHKAFDSTPDLEVAIKKLIQLKITRVLTGGGVGDVMNNLDALKDLQEKYKDDIQLLIGGGVRSHNVQEILEYTKVNQVHFSGRIRIFDNSTYVTGTSDDKDLYSYDGGSEEKLKAIIKEVRKAELLW